MRLGDHVIWEDRVYVLRGFAPMSVPDGRAEIADPSSDEPIDVPMDELRPTPPPHE